MLRLMKLNSVAITGLLVAAIRAEESTRPDRLFDDPYAAALAGERGRVALATYRSVAMPVPIIEVRTRFFDEGLERVAREGIRQIVILAAGMDARAHRLAWPGGTRVFELDQPDVLAHKGAVLDAATPACERVAVPVDLATDWTVPLRAAGLDPAVPTAWLVEGLLQYLPAATVGALFERIERLSARGSVVLHDCIAQSLLDAPPMAPMLAMMRDLGAPWVFGTDDPASLLSRAWAVTPTDPGELGRRVGRWPFPAAPAGTRVPPSGFFVEARKG